MSRVFVVVGFRFTRTLADNEIRVRNRPWYKHCYIRLHLCTAKAYSIVAHCFAVWKDLQSSLLGYILPIISEPLCSYGFTDYIEWKTLERRKQAISGPNQVWRFWVLSCACYNLIMSAELKTGGKEKTVKVMCALCSFQWHKHYKV